MTRELKRIAALVASIGLGLAGLTAAPGAMAAPPHHGHAPHSGYTPPPIAWAACDIFGFDAECGRLTVPLDYRHPSGRKIRLAVSRVVHTVPDSQYQGVMLVNPGGPGGSGFIYSILGGFVPNGAGAAYDWIGFDPRGVGASTPSLACDGDYTDYGRPNYIPFTKAIEQAWLRKSSRYADDCDAAGGALLDHLKTTDSAADMESLRKALGRQRINFYGFSYGTYLAQVYATLYPDRVRRMVLDSNVDPRRVWYDANLDQDPAFQKTFDVYMGWLARYDSVYHLGTTARAVKRVYNTQLRRLTVHPADGVFGPNELTDVFTGPAYYVYGWTDVADAFSAWVNDGDISGLRALWEGSFPTGEGADNGYAMYLATECTDAHWPQSWNTWRRDNWRIFDEAPFLTWANVWFNAPCRDWSGHVGRPVGVDGRQVHNQILLIDETLDPATPFEGSLEVRSRFPRSSLIEGVGGTTHAGSLSGVACVDDAIATYLTNGTVPQRLPGRRSDLKCDPVPQPVPEGAAAARQRAPKAAAGMPAVLRDALMRAQLH